MLGNRTFLLLIGVTVALFTLRTYLVPGYQAPLLNDLFTAFAVIGSLVEIAANPRALRRSEWTAALTLGVIVGVGVPFATLFSPYPFWGVVRSLNGQALARGIITGITAVGGLAIVRRGGPVQVSFARTERRRGLASLELGVGVGLPLTVVNVLALQMTTGKPIDRQPLAAAMLDAFQPE